MSAADFSDPFHGGGGAAALPSQSAPAPLSVTEVNQRAKNLLERTLGMVTVVGEVSNYKIVGGHAYFSLKDNASQLSAALFKRELMGLTFKLADGMQVIATGKLTIYGAYGRYQMVIERIEPRGAGALQQAFEELKQRLGREGLFAQARKRRLPLVPRRVAVITSPTGAVIRDIVHVAHRRFPRAHIVVIPTRVQGVESAQPILAALERLTALVVAARSAPASDVAQKPWRALDVLIIARGGGSLEDLWGFNDERVARAIAACPIPVVSAVGHETDFTIADFVADVRAPTPSAAAELVFPVLSELLTGFGAHVHRMAQALRRYVDRQWYRLRAGRSALGDGRSVIREQMQRITYTQARSQSAMRTLLGRRTLLLRQYDVRLSDLHPKLRLREIRNRLQRARDRLVWLMQQRMVRGAHRLSNSTHKLHALSPLSVLDRGYSIVQRVADGAVLRDATQAGVGDAVMIRLAQGKINARVEDILPAIHNHELAMQHHDKVR